MGRTNKGYYVFHTLARFGDREITDLVLVSCNKVDLSDIKMQMGQEFGDGEWDSDYGWFWFDGYANFPPEEVPISKEEYEVMKRYIPYREFV